MPNATAERPPRRFRPVRAWLRGPAASSRSARAAGRERGVGAGERQGGRGTRAVEKAVCFAYTRVFALDMARCPWCHEGTLRFIAAITQGEVIRRILQHLKLAADPPLMAPARLRQETFSWSSV